MNMQNMDNVNPIYRPSALFGYELAPDTEFRFGKVNSYGMIGKEYKLDKESNVYRILLLGDSIAQQNWGAEFLEEKLNNNPILNKKYKFEIWNAGVASWDIRRYANYLEYKGIKYNPDMVLIFFWNNDVGSNTAIYYKTKEGLIECDFPIRRLQRKYNPNPFLIRHSYLYRLVLMRLENYLISKRMPEVDGKKQDAKFYLNKIKDLCQEKQIPLVGVLFCYLKPFSEWASYDKRDYELMKKVLDDSNISYFDLHNYLPEEKRYGLRFMKDDDIHPSREGNKIIADLIYDYLLTKTSIASRRMR